MKKIRQKYLVIIVILMIPVGILSFNNISDRDFKLVKNLDIFYSLFKELNYFYVDETDPEDLIKTGIDEMLESLDPYTTYIPESEMDDFTFMTTGQYGGIGALIRRAGDFTIISEPYEGFPAQKAGLLAGDTIIEIDGQSLRGMDLSKVSEQLKGTPGTKLKLLISRPGDSDSFEQTLIREKVKIDNVPYFGIIEDGVGYIRLSNFTNGASDEVKNAVEELKTSGASSLILDIRNNPGGLLIEAVRIANIFVQKNIEIVSTRGKVKQWDKIYNTLYEPIDTIMPLAILVSRGSASASEIVAGAMQDLDRAVIIGQRTFGKGLVQTTRPLSYNSQLKVTTAKYYIPSGRCIQALDYSHRNEDGSVGHVPDSLISEFSTQNGRKVYDGGGITPDIKIELDKIGRLVVSLFSNQLFFDYATQFRTKYDSIATPEQFVINDEIFEDFLNYLEEQDFEYETETDLAFKELKEAAKKDNYFEIASEEFDLLESKISHDIKTDLEQYRDEISEMIRDEIVSRYYFQKGRIRSALIDDEEVNEALKVLADQEKYHAILKGTIKGEEYALK